MAALSTKRATGALHGGAVLVVTHGRETSYSVDGYGSITAMFARKLMACSSEAGVKSQGDLFMVPNEDGLFPGMSQTWRNHR